MSYELDGYFLEICKSVSSNSKCLSRKLGAVIVKDRYIVSTGYNGPATGCPHCNDADYRARLLEDVQKENGIALPEFKKELSICPRKIIGYDSGGGLQYCQASHAERNAIYAAARLGHPLEGCTLFLNWVIPCVECSKAIINSGIKEVVVTELKDYESVGILGRYLLVRAGINLRVNEQKL
jgi:dCMP deaminase